MGISTQHSAAGATIRWCENSLSAGARILSRTTSHARESFPLTPRPREPLPLTTRDGNPAEVVSGWESRGSGVEMGISTQRVPRVSFPLMPGYRADEAVAYFCTITVLEWLAVFIDRRYCDPMFDSLRYCRAHKDLWVNAYVLMPNHLHLIAGTNAELQPIMRDFKRFTSRSIHERVFRQKLRYLHENPVRKGLVTRPEDWWYSSARIEAALPDAPMGIDPWYA